MTRPMFDADGAAISSNGLYRYRLWRTIGSGKTIVFVGLNPSTADATTDDPTLRKLMGFARRDGFGRLELLNLYNYRATDARAMWDQYDNDRIGSCWMARARDALAGCDKVVCCWGGFTKARKVEVVDGQKRADRVVDFLQRLGHQLHRFDSPMTKNGQPGHPLYLKKTTAIIPWKPGDRP